MKVKYIEPIKMTELEESISFLSNYVPVEGETHVVGESVEEIYIEATELLRELGELNKRRAVVISKLISL